MISAEEAIKIISEQNPHFGNEDIDLLDAVGRVTASDWTADRDFPPFNRVMMDGITIRYDDWGRGNRSFKIEKITGAGRAQVTLENPNQCVEIMTGCILPCGADTVIRYEDLSIENGIARIEVETLRKGQNIHSQGQDRLKDAVLLVKGKKITSADIGIAASIGNRKINVVKLPSVMIVSTGDELINIEATPQDFQIRRSNVYSIKTLLKQWNIDADLAHLDDEESIIYTKLEDYLHHYDVIILSGGVSKGKFDYIPEILSKLGVEKLFHRVKQRPGKPFWFGTKGNTTVFALPGNPISSFVCTLKYFRHWLDLTTMGMPPAISYAALSKEVYFKPHLTYFMEVKLDSDKNGTLVASPCKGNGSGDLANLTRADGFIELPMGKEVFKVGEVFSVIRY